MNLEQKKLIVMLNEDIKTDVENLDGLPFTGSAVGETLGKIYAVLYALTNLIDELHGQ